MIKKFISPIKDCKFRMNISGLLFIIIFAIQLVLKQYTK